jgi:hypothetical protein
VISTAWAANSPLNGTALAIIIGAGLTFLLFYIARKKWQRRKLAHVDGDD